MNETQHKATKPHREWVTVDDGDTCFACGDECEDAQIYLDGNYFCCDRCADQHIQWNGDRDGAVRD